MTLEYKVKTATKEEISSHLYCCDDNFKQALIQRVSIEEYSGKIFEKAITFEAWDDNVLVGLIAVYCNHPNGTSSGYITNVSIDKDFTGRGIATTLMNNCLEYAQKAGIKNIALEVLSSNDSAIRLYEKFGFEKSEIRGDMVLMLKINKGDLNARLQ